MEMAPGTAAGKPAGWRALRVALCLALGAAQIGCEGGAKGPDGGAPENGGSAGASRSDAGTGGVTGSGGQSGAANGGAAGGGTSAQGGSTGMGGGGRSSGKGGSSNGGASAGGASVGGKGGSSSGGAAGASASTGGAPGGGGAGGSTHAGPWKVMMLGDSITAATCYPQLVSKGLIDAGHTIFSSSGRRPTTNPAAPSRSKKRVTAATA